MPKNLSGLTGLRALACLSVIAYHLNQQRSIENLSTWNWDFYQFVETWPVTVSFFFVLGGMLRSVPYWRTIFSDAPAPEAKKALIDRFLRIAPAYYVALFGTLAAVYVLQGHMDNAVSRILAGAAFLSWIHPSTFFPTDFNGPLWYIAFDMTGGLAVIAVMGTLAKMPKKYVWAGFAGAGAALLLAHFLWIRLPFPPGEGPLSLWFPIYNPFLFGLHFLLGMAFWGLAVRSEIAGWKPGYRFDLAFVLSIGAVLAFLWHVREAEDFAYSWPWGPYRFPLVPLLLGTALFTVGLSKKIGAWLDNRLFAWIAKTSYSAYLYHALVIAILRHTLFPGNAVAWNDWLLLVAIAVPVSFVLAWLSYSFVEMRAVSWYRARTSK